MKQPNLVIAIQPDYEPMLSLVKVIAEYGLDEVLEAMTMAEIYIHEPDEETKTQREDTPQSDTTERES
jgi:hypothetical protein